MRAQTANLALASQAAATVEARTKRGGDVNLNLPRSDRGRTAPALAAPSPVRVLEPNDARTAPWLADVEKQELLEAVNDG